MSIEYYKQLNKSYETDINVDGDVALQPTKAIFKIRLNGICEVEINVPYDEEGRWKLLEDGGVLRSPTPYSEHQLFAIYDTNRKMTGLTIKAHHIFFDLCKSTIDDVRAVNTTCKSALDILLAGTKYTGDSNITKISTCYFIDGNRVNFINGSNDNSILNRWGGELFLNNYKITINNKIGDDYGVEITYGLSLADIGLSSNENSIITRCKPKAFNGRKLPEVYIDSPLINNYRIIHEGYVEMSDLKLKEDSQDGTGFNTLEELYVAMRKRVADLYKGGLDKPSVTGNIKVAALENTLDYTYIKNIVNIGLGDVVHINHKNIGENILSRCIGYDWNILTRKYENVIIGENIKNYFEKSSESNTKINGILNSDGTVNSNEIKGIIDGLKNKFKAQSTIAEKQQVRAILFEDLDTTSPNFGALAIGTLGLEIAGTRTPDNKDWNWNTLISAGVVASEWLVGKLKTVLIQNMDGSFELDLTQPGGCIFRNNGHKSISINKNLLEFYDWEGTERTQRVGSIFSSRRQNDPTRCGTTMSHEPGTHMSLCYYNELTKFHEPYIDFDKFDKITGLNPITVRENIGIKHGKSIYFGDGNQNEIYNDVTNNLTLAVDVGLFIYDKAKKQTLIELNSANNYPIHLRKPTQVEGNLYINGNVYANNIARSMTKTLSENPLAVLQDENMRLITFEEYNQLKTEVEELKKKVM